MKGNKFDRTFLRVVLIINLIVLIPILLRKPPIKDWLLVYLYNAATNCIADGLLVSKNIVKYPVRFFPNLFQTHILFDFLIYPTFSVLYNQLTMKDRPFAIFYKMFYFTIPMVLIEYWAVRKTGLIKWKKGWQWYHTFVSVTIKSLITRVVIGIIRVVDRSQKAA